MISRNVLVNKLNTERKDSSRSVNKTNAFAKALRHVVNFKLKNNKMKKEPIKFSTNSKIKNKKIDSVDGDSALEEPTIKMEFLSNDTFIEKTEKQLINRGLSSIVASPTSMKNKLMKNEIGKIAQYIFFTRNKVDEQNEYELLLNSKRIELLMDKLKFISLLLFIVSLVSVLSVILEYEISFKCNTIDGKRTWANNYPITSSNSEIMNLLNIFVLWICFISSILLWVLIVMKYYLECELECLKKGLPLKIWLYDYENLLYLAFNLIIFFVHPNPIVKDIKIPYYLHKYDTNLYYSLNSIFSIVSMLRIWYFFEYYLLKFDHYSSRNDRICDINKFNFNFKYLLKSITSHSPFGLYVTMLVICLIFCSFGVKVFEREVDAFTKLNFASYLNVIWVLTITMTTVGYGDIYPLTLWGRAMVIGACLFGIILISMLIVTITSILNFDNSEREVFILIQKIALGDEKDILAAKLVVKYLRLIKNIKINKNSLQNEDLKNQLLLQKLKFKQKLDQIKFLSPPYSNYDNIIDELGYLEYSLDDIINKYEEFDLKDIVDEQI